MLEQLNKVAEFHKVFKERDGKWPQNLSEPEAVLRYKLMAEENEEYLQACAENSLVEIADALGDKLYILCGTILKHGMQHVIEDVFNVIHASNMSKVGPNGEAVIREDGKILKGEGYFKPDLTKFINE
jgi:predicted HAD superfamily Cof-like phosphohydrolase